jgi:hypothetical protein
MNALQTYRALTLEQRAVLRDRKVSGSYAPAALLGLLRPLGDVDSAFARLRKQAIVGAIISGVLTIGFALAGVGIGFLVPLAATVGFIILAVRLTRADLSDHIRTVAIPFLSILREDMTPDAVAEVQLDLSKALEKSKKTGEQPRDNQGPYFKIVDHLYVDPWFSGRAELADGVRLHWSIADHIVMRRRSKKSRSGKTKLKTKYKKRSRLRVELKLPAKTYAVEPVAASASLQVQARQGVNLVKVRSVVRADSIDPLDVRPLVDLVALAYQRAQPPGQGAAS